MSYLGQAALKNSELKRFDVTSSTSATHVLSWTAPNEQSLFITINGVKQQDDAYSIAGIPTTVTLTDALIATDKMEVIGILDIGVITVVGDNSVSSNALANNAVTTGKILDGTIVAGDLANLAVTDAKLATGIDAVKLADGTVTNTELQYINSLTSNAQTQLTARLPLAGGTMSGALQMADQLVQRPEFKDYAETSSAEGNVTGTVNIDMVYGNVVTATIVTGATTLNFINPPASGKAGTITLLLTNGGSQTVTWDPQIDWAGGTAPTLTSAGIDVLTFITVDEGATWYGFAAGLAMA